MPNSCQFSFDSRNEGVGSMVSTKITIYLNSFPVNKIKPNHTIKKSFKNERYFNVLGIFCYWADIPGSYCYQADCSRYSQSCAHSHCRISQTSQILKRLADYYGWIIVDYSSFDRGLSPGEQISRSDRPHGTTSWTPSAMLALWPPTLSNPSHQQQGEDRGRRTRRRERRTGRQGQQSGWRR